VASRTRKGFTQLGQSRDSRYVIALPAIGRYGLPMVVAGPVGRYPVAPGYGPRPDDRTGPPGWNSRERRISDVGQSDSGDRSEAVVLVLKARMPVCVGTGAGHLLFHRPGLRWALKGDRLECLHARGFIFQCTILGAGHCLLGQDRSDIGVGSCTGQQVAFGVFLLLGSGFLLLLSERFEP